MRQTAHAFVLLFSQRATFKTGLLVAIKVSVLLIRTVNYLVTTRLYMCACTQVGIDSMRFLHQNPSQYLFGKTVKVVTSELSSRVNSFCFYQTCACFRIIHLVISLFCSCSCSVTSLRLSNCQLTTCFFSFKACTQIFTIYVLLKPWRQKTIDTARHLPPAIC